MTRMYWINTPEGRRYRTWETVSDTWGTEPLTREQMSARIAAWSIGDAWLDRVDARNMDEHDEGHIAADAWWLSGAEADCEAMGHQELQPDGSCLWCGATAASPPR